MYARNRAHRRRGRRVRDWCLSHFSIRPVLRCTPSRPLGSLSRGEATTEDAASLRNSRRPRTARSAAATTERSSLARSRGGGRGATIIAERILRSSVGLAGRSSETIVVARPRCVRVCVRIKRAESIQRDMPPRFPFDTNFFRLSTFSRNNDVFPSDVSAARAIFATFYAIRCDPTDEWSGL